MVNTISILTDKISEAQSVLKAFGYKGLKSQKPK